MGLLSGISNALFGGDSSGQEAAAAQSNAVQKQIFDQQRKDNEPWRQAGVSALSQLQDNSFNQKFGDTQFQADPGYQFRMDEGQKALERSAAARGGLNSGATLKALTRYGQDFGSNEYNNAYNRFTNDQTNRFNRLSSISGGGQVANQAIGQAGQNYANQYGNNVQGAANANAAASQSGMNTLMQAGSTALGAYAAFSDRNLKQNIIQLPVSKYKDVPTYLFEYVNPQFGYGKQIGVMAQDLLALDSKHPAVIKTDIGLAVDYSLLEEAA